MGARLSPLRRRLHRRRPTALLPLLSTTPSAGDYVRLSPTAVAIVDTPVFQRLRYLKQLGTAGGCCASARRRRQRFPLLLRILPPPAPTSSLLRPATTRCSCCRIRLSRGHAHPVCAFAGRGPPSQGGQGSASWGSGGPPRGSASTGSGMRCAKGACARGPLAAACRPVGRALTSRRRFDALKKKELPPFASAIHPHAAKQEIALKLVAKQPELALTDSDLLVLEVAGGCRSAESGGRRRRWEGGYWESVVWLVGWWDLLVLEVAGGRCSSESGGWGDRLLLLVVL